MRRKSEARRARRAHLASAHAANIDATRARVAADPLLAAAPDEAALRIAAAELGLDPDAVIREIDARKQRIA